MIRQAALVWTAVILAATGCGGGGAPPGDASAVVGAVASTAPASPAPEVPEGYTSVTVGAAPYAWPVAELTITTTPHGTPHEVSADDREVAASVVKSSGGTERLEDVLESIRYQQELGVFFDQVRARYPDQYSAAANSDGREPGWVALTGTVPADLVPLAEALPVAVELRGGAAMSDAERERALGPAIDAFTADVYPGGQRAGSSGGLDAPTGFFEIDYAPNRGEEDGRNHADEHTLTLMAQAAAAAIGREVPYSARFTSDVEDSDPRRGFAAPVVEQTATQVRIAIGAYLRKGPQACGASPLTPLVVELSAPLGGRTLVDVNGAVDDGPDGFPATDLQTGLVTPAAP